MTGCTFFLSLYFIIKNLEWLLHYEGGATIMRRSISYVGLFYFLHNYICGQLNMFCPQKWRLCSSNQCSSQHCTRDVQHIQAFSTLNFHHEGLCSKYNIAAGYEGFLYWGLHITHSFTSCMTSAITGCCLIGAGDWIVLSRPL